MTFSAQTVPRLLPCKSSTAPEIEQRSVDGLQAQLAELQATLRAERQAKADAEAGRRRSVTQLSELQAQLTELQAQTPRTLSGGSRRLSPGGSPRGSPRSGRPGMSMKQLQDIKQERERLQAALSGLQTSVLNQRTPSD